MNGQIAKMNLARGMVAVNTPHGYSIFEMLSENEFQVGDEVRWEDDVSHGDTLLVNESQGFSCVVYFQVHHVPASQLDQQLLF